MTSISSKEKEKLPSECDYPMCPAAKDANFELERHNEVRRDLEEIKRNQGVIASEVRAAVIELKQIAVLFSETSHLKDDINKLGDKLRHLEETTVINIYEDIKTIGKEQFSWAKAIIIALVTSGISLFGGFIFARLTFIWGK